jgi:phenylpropionate dioxygenase-like ring-hydroxylating dioxygenase large terminal subunit
MAEAGMIVTRQPVLKKFWYPVMPVTALGDAPVPFVLLGEKLVLWKTKDGVACLKDRCCHRTAKLSLGYLEDGNVVCGYHGWTFDGEGECVRIPQQPDQPIPKKARVDAYKTELKYGYVWVALDEPLTGIPDFLEAGLPGFRQVHQFYETWDIGALRLMENSFDSAHVAFVHRATFGDAQNPKITGREMHEKPFGFVSRQSAEVKVRGDLAHKAVHTADGRTVSNTESEWFMPFIRRSSIHYPHGLIHVLITCATPMTDDRSMILQWVYRNDTEQDVSSAEVIAFDRAITLEDKAILESCEADVPLSVVDDEELHMLSDRPGLVMRKMLSQLLREYGETEQRLAMAAE